MPEYLTYGRALELLRELVAEFGEDYVYADGDDDVVCLYVHGHGPGCGVGHVLYRAGVPLDVLRDADDTDQSPVLEVAAFREYADDEALQLLSDFQVEQDQGTAWGEALRIALAPVGGSDV